MKPWRELRLLKSRRWMIVTAVIGLVLLGYFDWITGPNVTITCFYLVPVFLLTWFAGKGVGYSAAMIQALVWLALDAGTIGLGSPLVYWNAAVRFVTLAAVVWLVYLCKHLMRENEILVNEKTTLWQREADSRAAAAEALQRLAHEVSSAEDAERRRLGHALHDSLGQSLALLKLRLESLAADGSGAARTRQGLRESVELVSDLIRRSRTLTFELHPSMLDQLGLTATLQHLAGQIAEQTKATIRVVDAGPPLSIPAPVAAFLFRATRELLTNALKHGKAREVLVQVRWQSDRVRIVVNDDGSGFVPEDRPSAGIGLAWIKERARSLGGDLEIESTQGQGARVAVDVLVTPALAKGVANGQPAAC